MKDLAAVILGGEKQEPEVDGYETVASEILQGLENKDPKLFSKSLKNFISMCEAEEEAEVE
jgi:hypothetical protein